MKQTEYALAAVVAAFAAFVGVMAVRAPRMPHPEDPAVAAKRERAANTPPKVDSSMFRYMASLPRPAQSLPVDRRIHSENALPQRDLVDIRRRIADATDSYMPEMLNDLGGGLTRWPERRFEGLRVWVETKPTAVHDWDDRYAQVARDAFDDWRDGLPARLDYVYDAAGADIKIHWIDKFPADLGQRVGVTTRDIDQYGWLVSAQITIAIHDSAGHAIPPDDLAGIARHEAGHALGLGHSRDPKTKMFYVETVRDVQPADRATLRLLYSFPPGRVTPAP